MANVLFLVYIIGIIARLCTYMSSLADTVKDRIEISTALTSWKRGS